MSSSTKKHGTITYVCPILITRRLLFFQKTTIRCFLIITCQSSRPSCKSKVKVVGPAVSPRSMQQAQQPSPQSKPFTEAFRQMYRYTTIAQLIYKPSTGLKITLNVSYTDQFGCFNLTLWSLSDYQQRKLLNFSHVCGWLRLTSLIQGICKHTPSHIACKLLGCRFLWLPSGVLLPQLVQSGNPTNQQAQKQYMEIGGKRRRM